MTALKDQSCRPRSGGAERIDERQAAELLGQLPGWELEAGGGAIRKTFRFPDFLRTMSFVNAVAHIANREDHHPDLSVSYGSCNVRYNTHDVGGLSMNDFICAAQVDALAA